MTNRSSNQSSGRLCAYQDCNVRTSGHDHPLCQQHYFESQRGVITKCSRCSNFKPARFPLCSSCFVGHPRPTETYQDKTATTVAKDKYAVESSPAWAAGDANASQFYVYILRLAGGEFYIGQTRELPERLSEHRDGKVASTRNRKPGLVWFTELPTREAAAGLESELKQIRDQNERAIRRMIVRFQSLVRELDRD